MTTTQMEDHVTQNTDYVLDTPTPEKYDCARIDCDKQAQTVWVHWFEALNGPTVAFYGACEDHRPRWGR